MKKILLFFVFVIVTVFLFADQVDISKNSSRKLFDHVSYGTGSTEVTFALDGYEIETTEVEGVEYKKISYWNEGEFIEVGKPALPRFSRLIAIPDAGSVEFDIIYTEEEIISNVNIFPRQNLQSESQPADNEFVIDETFYTDGDVFPGRVVEIGEPAIMRDFRVVNVTINPFQYDPQTRELRILTNVDIVVNTSGTTGENIKQTDRKLSRFFEPIYQSTILNYESVNTREDGFQQPCYLFIYPDDATIESNLDYLTDWKHQKGFEVHTANTALTGTTNTSIKAYIQDAYDTWENPPEFVCLVGDVTGSYIIPTFYITYYNAEGDHPYSQLEGGDILADVILGRISISSLADLQTYVAKVLYYEKEPYMLETGWYNKSLMVADTSPSGPSTVFTNQSIVELMQQHAPNIVATEVYSSDDIYTCDEMTSNLNSGVSYFNYRGWLGMSGFGITNINDLINFKKLPFAVILTCSTGSFDGTCQSEAFIRAGSAGNPTGAIASIGTATIGTHTNFNNCIDAGIYYGIFVDGIYNPGGALNRGKLALYEHYPQNPGGYVDNFSHMNTLMGDPGVELWTGVPKDMIVNYDTQVSAGTNYIEVTVENVLGVPLSEAWITILKDEDVIFSTGYTESAGKILLSLEQIGIGSELGTVNLTVTKHDFKPHIGSFEIVNSDVFVNIDDFLIDDDNSGTSSGNGDGIVNPGEDIELNVSLKNFGIMTANNITAVISTEDDFITITDDNESYGNITAGSSTYSSDDFDFSVNSNVLGGTEIQLEVVIQDAFINQWTDYIFILVEGANLYANDYSVIDGNNSVLDPGETAQLEVTIENIGSVGTNAIYGTLMSTDNRITINDSIGYFGNISAGGQAINSTNRFELIANTQIIPGSQFILELHLYNADGYDSTVQFLLGIGEVSITDPVGPDAYGYFCYDDGDTGYLNVPTYDWIEINGIGINLNLSDLGDDGDIETISSLPITFRMYGEEYDSATVCSNGWIAPGGSTQASFMNSPIPGPQGPSPMIAPFWDDLKTGTGDVYWYYDSSLHIVIIEWDHMQNDYNNDEETFQAILYDANYYPTTSGDSEIKFQYKVINNTSAGSYPSQHGQYASVGIEDPTGTIGLEYTFNNTYPDAAKHMQNEMALQITSHSIPLEEPFIVLGCVTINDTNGNGLIDYGEDIDLDITLNNIGENTATGVSAVLSSSDTYITITANSSNYNDISGGVSGVNLTDYEFTVTDTCPDGHIVSFQLDVVSNEDNWNLNFALEVNAPKIEYSYVYIDDGDNIMLDPGETTDILVTFTNNGGADAYSTSAFISTDDIYLTINSATFDFGTFQSGQSEIAVFNVTADAGAPIGHSAVVNWDITADYSYTAEDSFSIFIGLVIENFETGNFSTHPWIFSGNADWSVVTEDPYEGTYCAKSDSISDNQTSELMVTMEIGISGWMSFYRKVSSENNYDYLIFLVDGMSVDSWSGEIPWAEVSYYVDAGNHTFEWSYEKDSGTSSGSDCAWIDYIIFPYPQPPLTLPYETDFDVGGSLPSRWMNGIGDDFNWSVNSGSTQSSSTGPPGDHTTGSGYYNYTESSTPNYPNKRADLLTPQFDISSVTNPYFAFWYHMYGSTMGELHVDIYEGSSWTNDVMIPISGNQGDTWFEQLVDLSGFTGTIQIRFRGITGSSYTSDMAIDDFWIGDFFPPDITVNPVILTEALDVNQSSSQNLYIRNAGSGILDYTATISYSSSRMDHVPSAYSDISNIIKEPEVRIELETKRSPSPHGFQNPEHKSIRDRDYATIGAGSSISTSTNDTPFGTFYQDGQNQYLFTASELSTAGLVAGDINAVGWNIASAAAQVMNGFNVELKHTTATSVTGFETGFTNCYSGTWTASAGWNDISFSTPFTWDGASNLLVKICFDNTSYTSNSSCYIDTYTAMNGWAYNDNTSGCSDPYEGTIDSRPQIRFAGSTFNWLTLNGGSSVSGSIDPGSPDDILNVLFDTVTDSLTDGIYEANIEITSNDPDEPSIIVPVTLTVSQQLDPPANVQIQLNSSSIQLSWDAVPGATSYKVYSSDDPYTGFTEDTTGMFNVTSWTTLTAAQKKFYYVKAIN